MVVTYNKFNSDGLRRTKIKWQHGLLSDGEVDINQVTYIFRTYKAAPALIK